MSCVHVVEVEWVHALLCFRRSFGGLDPSRIAVCWSGVWGRISLQGGLSVSCCPNRNIVMDLQIVLSMTLFSFSTPSFLSFEKVKARNIKESPTVGNCAPP